MASLQETHGLFLSEEGKLNITTPPSSPIPAPSVGRNQKKIKQNSSGGSAKNIKRRRLEFTDIVMADNNERNLQSLAVDVEKPSDDLNTNDPIISKKPKKEPKSRVSRPKKEKPSKPSTMIVSDTSDTGVGTAVKEDKQNKSTNNTRARTEKNNKEKCTGKSKQGSCKRCSLNHTKTCQYYQEPTLSNEIVSIVLDD